MNHQRGVALFTAMLMITIAGILAASLARNGALAFKRDAIVLQSHQARAFAVGIEQYAAIGLLADLEETGSDSRSETWAQPLPPLTVPGGELRGRLVDLDGRINVNNLLDPNLAPITETRLRRLFSLAGANPNLMTELLDFIDEDTTPRPGGGEDYRYTIAQPPYRTPNRELASVESLRLLASMDRELYARVEPALIALPSGTAINVNSAVPLVLQSLDDNITPSQAEQWYANGRAQHRSMQDFRTLLAERSITLNTLGLSVNSQYFEALAEVELTGNRFRYVSWLHRQPGSVKVVRRSD